MLFESYHVPGAACAVVLLLSFFRRSMSSPEEKVTLDMDGAATAVSTYLALHRNDVRIRTSKHGFAIAIRQEFWDEYSTWAMRYTMNIPGAQWESRGRYLVARLSEREVCHALHFVRDVGRHEGSFDLSFDVDTDHARTLFTAMSLLKRS